MAGCLFECGHAPRRDGAGEAGFVRTRESLRRVFCALLGVGRDRCHRSTARSGHPSHYETGALGGSIRCKVTGTRSSFATCVIHPHPFLALIFYSCWLRKTCDTTGLWLPTPYVCSKGSSSS